MGLTKPELPDAIRAARKGYQKSHEMLNMLIDLKAQSDFHDKPGGHPLSSDQFDDIKAQLGTLRTERNAAEDDLDALVAS